MLMKLMTALMSVLVLSVTAKAAVHPQFPAKPANFALVEETRQALSMPAENRLQALQEQGPQSYRNLITLMFDQAQPMEVRWNAITTAAEVGGKDSLPELKRAHRQGEWFMRSASLVGAANIDRSLALKWARELISDRALVVRAAAVDTMARLKDVSSTSLLWKKLYAAENFHHKQSLFIRKRIVEALALLESPGHEAKFVALLSDADDSLHPLAVKALERTTSKILGDAREPVKFKRERWQKWGREQTQTRVF